jgi:hypothetical protein
MDTYQRYDHTIKEEDLLRVLREAASHGYMSWIVINGEYYTVKLDPEKVPSAVSADLF